MRFGRFASPPLLLSPSPAPPVDAAACSERRFRPGRFRCTTAAVNFMRCSRSEHSVCSRAAQLVRASFLAYTSQRGSALRGKIDSCANKQLCKQTKAGRQVGKWGQRETQRHVDSLVFWRRHVRHLAPTSENPSLGARRRSKTFGERFAFCCCS
jgi:hypothetical protein